MKKDVLYVIASVVCFSLFVNFFLLDSKRKVLLAGSDKFDQSCTNIGKSS
jgi:hypothetical protein